MALLRHGAQQLIKADSRHRSLGSPDALLSARPCPTHSLVIIIIWAAMLQSAHTCDEHNETAAPERGQGQLATELYQPNPQITGRSTGCGCSSRPLTVNTCSACRVVNRLLPSAKHLPPMPTQRATHAHATCSETLKHDRTADAHVDPYRRQAGSPGWTTKCMVFNTKVAVV